MRVFSAILSVVFLITSLNGQVKFCLTEKNRDSPADLKKIISLQCDTTLYKHSFLNITGQVITGAAAGVAFAAIPILLSMHGKTSGLSYLKSLRNAMFTLFYGGLFLMGGTALGVYWIAQYENPGLSLSGTLSSSFIGGGAGILFYIVSNIPVGLVFPLIGSIVYTTLIADWIPEVEAHYENNLPQEMYSHKDIVNESMILELDILRIPL